MTEQLVVGIFVGGRGSRMGGAHKGLLRAPDSSSSVIARLLEQLRVAVPSAEIVLVGDARAYEELGLATVSDQPTGIGPLGGLLALLEHAAARRAAFALALACDLPKLTSGLIARLAVEAPAAQVLAVAQADVHNPLIARYAVAPSLPAARAVLASGARSLQAVLARLAGPTLLRLSASEELCLQDWDRPEDIG